MKLSDYQGTGNCYYVLKGGKPGCLQHLLHMIASEGLTVRQIVQINLKSKALGVGSLPEFIVVVDPKPGFTFDHSSGY